MEVYCGEKSTQVYDADTWLPDETIEALKEYIVSIKGPLNNTSWRGDQIAKCITSDRF